MRAVLITVLLLLAVPAVALAQGYVYKPSGLEFASTQPVEAGQRVQGLIMQSSGIMMLGEVRVDGTESDDLFTYWHGTFNHGSYYYDVYSGTWKPGPVRYQRAALNFQGDLVEGWVRVFGGLVDTNHFLGQDGVLYKRVNIKRNRHRKTNQRRAIIYTYFVNMETGERSDGGTLPALVIGEGGAEWLSQQMALQEQAYRKIVEQNPAFPQWETEAQVAPAEVVVATGTPDKEQLSLLQEIEKTTSTDVKVESGSK